MGTKAEVSIDLTPVESSNVAAIGHDQASSTLRVQFKNGSVYDYHDVPAEKHEALMKATDSHGGHLFRHIKPNHSFTRIA